MDIGRYVLVASVSILAIALVIWRRAYEWIIGHSVFRERVYVMGSGPRAHSIVETLRNRRDVGMEVVTGENAGAPGEDLDRFAKDLAHFARRSTHRPHCRCHGGPSRIDAGS